MQMSGSFSPKSVRCLKISPRTKKSAYTLFQMIGRIILPLGIWSIAAPAFAQKATVKDSVVYRDGVPYCKIFRLNTSVSSPRFSFKTLEGKMFALAQRKAGDGFVIYFTELDTLIPIEPAIPYANSVAGMIVQYDLLAEGRLPDPKAVRRLARLEARGPEPIQEALRGVAQDVDNVLRGSRPATKSPKATSDIMGLLISGNNIMLRGRLLGQYSVQRFVANGASYKSIRITRPDGSRVAEAELLVSDATSCKLRLPQTHQIVELPVPYFPEKEQVKQIAQYLLDYSYLE